MKLTINNTSQTTAFWKTEGMKRLRKLKAGATVCVDIQKTAVRLFVRPKGSTSNSDTASVFTVMSEYRFEVAENMTLTLSFEKARADMDMAFHTFRRMSCKGFAVPYHVTYRVIPPEKVRNAIAGFFGESLMNLLLDAGLPVLFGLIAWANTDSVVKGLIAAAVTLVVITAVTLGTEKLFDALSDRRRKRKGLAGRKEPIGLTQCLDPAYIDCTFKKAGF